MAPPKFGDIGKKIEDLFKGFDTGKTAFTFKSKTAGGIALKVKGTKKNDKGVFAGEVETSGTHNTGLEWKETWTTNNEVKTEISKPNVFIKGTKVTGELTLSPADGFKSPVVKADYKNDAVVSSFKIADWEKVTANFSFSPFSNFYGGVEAKLKGFSEIAGYTGKVGYVDSDFEVTSAIVSKDPSRGDHSISGSIYHTPQSNTKFGVQFDNANKATNFQIGGAYDLEKNAEVKTYVNQDLIAGFAYKQKIGKGVTLGLYADINTTKFNEDAHKLGMSLEMNH